MADATILKDLNERQHEAVTAPLGHALVLAGAGSGKTRVLVSRMAWLVDVMGMSPYAILAVTFTNKAALEMKERLHHLLKNPVDHIWVGTFHGLCHRMLRHHHQRANLPAQFHILDNDDQARMIKRVIQSLQLDPEQWPVKQAQAFIHRKKDEGLRAQHVHAASYGPERVLLSIYKGYQEACLRAGVVDFAELLLLAHELLRDNPDLLAHYHQRLHVILVDEFQDTNTLQYAWIRLLASGGATVMAVGDDDQSIYGWRGAKVENLSAFARDFPQTHIVRLEQNYRSTATILHAANALIEYNDERMGKALWTQGPVGEKIVLFSAFNELEEARFVSERVTQALSRGRAASDIAVLYRSNAQSRVLEEALLRAGIPYQIYGGMRFFERMEIKDTLAYVRLLANVDDDPAFDRIVNVPARGLGDKTLDEVRTLARTSQLSLWGAAQQLLTMDRLTARAKTALTSFIRLIESLQQQVVDLSLDEHISCVLEKSGLYTHFAQMKGPEAETKIENLRELVSAAKQFRDESDHDDQISDVMAFLAHTSLNAGDVLQDHGATSVNMMTLHASKGLEFPVVFIVGMEEGLFPGKASLMDMKQIEEERRLCYVGITRAQEQLILSYAEIRRQYGREESHRPSRFLREIPSEYIDDIRHMSRSQASSQRVFASVSHASGFKLGQQVRHATFGTGTIMAMEGQDAQARVHIHFEDHEPKWLALAYANLKVD